MESSLLVSFFESRISKKFNKIDVRFDKVDARFDKVDDRFNKLETGDKDIARILVDWQTINFYMKKHTRFADLVCLCFVAFCLLI